MGMESNFQQSPVINEAENNSETQNSEISKIFTPYGLDASKRWPNDGEVETYTDKQITAAKNFHIYYKHMTGDDGNERVGKNIFSRESIERVKNHPFFKKAA